MTADQAAQAQAELDRIAAEIAEQQRILAEQARQALAEQARQALEAGFAKGQ